MADLECGFANPSLLQAHGPTISVHVGFDSDFRPGNGPPSLPYSRIPSLIDTGASVSCIDSLLAEELALPIMGRTSVASAHGLGEVNEYLAQIYIPALSITIHGRFDGVHLRAGGQPHDVLLGRSFLQYVTLHYEGATGRVVVSR